MPFVLCLVVAFFSLSFSNSTNSLSYPGLCLAFCLCLYIHCLCPPVGTIMLCFIPETMAEDGKQHHNPARNMSPDEFEKVMAETIQKQVLALFS
jgi:hypothetical protein